ncbi:hypothetical protein AHIS2_p043 [Acaryochloris phage A-HIS2]|nr:hypothetical protein AHIS2_p043 [Acaryochloris phage A-HIS2]
MLASLWYSFIISVFLMSNQGFTIRITYRSPVLHRFSLIYSGYRSPISDK